MSSEIKHLAGDEPEPTNQAPSASASERLAWSIDAENFLYDCKEEAIEACDHSDTLTVGRAIDFGEVITFDPAKWCDSGDVIDVLIDRAGDAGGEWAEDYPDVSKEACAELDAFLSTWLRKYCTPHFYGIKKAKEYLITQEDIDAYRSPESDASR
jgi:hypothetical protein